MISLLVDECCPRAVVDRLRADGHDVRYAAESGQRLAEVLAIPDFEMRGRLTIVESLRVRQRPLQQG